MSDELSFNDVHQALETKKRLTLSTDARKELDAAENTLRKYSDLLTTIYRQENGALRKVSVIGTAVIPANEIMLRFEVEDGEGFYVELTRTIGVELFYKLLVAAEHVVEMRQAAKEV